MLAALAAVVVARTGALDVSRVYAALNRSVDAYPPPPGWVRGDVGGSARRFLKSYLWDKRTTVLIYEGKVFVDRQFIEANNDKTRKHVSFVKSLLARDNATRLPNVAYRYSTTSTGECPGLEPWEPCLVMAKDPPDRPGVLIPNPYLGDWRDWHDFRKRLHAVAEESPFAARKRRAFWRGAIRPGKADPAHRTHDCAIAGGNYARLQAASLTLSASRFVDVRCGSTGVCAPREDAHFCDGVEGVPPMPYTPDMVAVTKKPAIVTSPRWTMQEDYAKYKYLLNLPGSTHGSYSRNLNHLWFLGSVVLQWRQPAVEWYYAALQDGETHVEVDHATLPEVVEALEGDPARAKRLVDGATAVDRRLLCADCVADYFDAVLRRLRDRWRADVVLDDPCAFAAFLEAEADAIGCAGLDLVEIVATYENKLMSNVNSWQNSFEAWTPLARDGRRHNVDGSRLNELPRMEKSSHGGWTHALVDARLVGNKTRGDLGSCGYLFHHATRKCEGISNLDGRCWEGRCWGRKGKSNRRKKRKAGRPATPAEAGPASQ